MKKAQELGIDIMIGGTVYERSISLIKLILKIYNKVIYYFLNRMNIPGPPPAIRQIGGHKMNYGVDSLLENEINDIVVCWFETGLGVFYTPIEQMK